MILVYFFRQSVVCLGVRNCVGCSFAWWETIALCMFCEKLFLIATVFYNNICSKVMMTFCRLFRFLAIYFGFGKPKIDKKLIRVFDLKERLLQANN